MLRLKKIEKKRPQRNKRMKKGTGLRSLFCCLLVLLVLRIVLSSSFLTKTVNKYAPQFVDGDLSFSKISASVFSSFPSVGLTLEDAVLTYPHDRFARFDDQAHLTQPPGSYCAIRSRCILY